MQVTYLSQNTKHGQQLVRNDPIWTPKWSDWSKMANNGPKVSKVDFK